MRDFVDVYGAWFYIFGFPVVCFIIAMLTGCSGTVVNYAPICTAPPVDAIESYIIDGTPSVDRRGTAKVILGSGYCSGTVVGPRTVLLAGHCKNPEVIAIENGAAYIVVEDIEHPEYNGNVRLDLRLAYTANDLPEPWVPIARETLVCEQLITQGYGFGSEGKLHERNVETVVRYDEVIIGTESICNGDSGGPLYAIRPDGSYVLVGVSSFGSGQPYVCDGPVGFMNLLVLGSWVEENIR